MNRVFVIVTLLAASLAGSPSTTNAQDPLSGEPRWYKGNLHTHSLWSDGDQFPEMIADWYVENGYNFLALSDHNTLSEGERWMSLKKVVDRSDEGILQRYRDRFGDAWVETRGTPGGDDHEVRLKPLDEFRNLVEQRGQFIMIAAEEISDRHDGKPIHINATNLVEKIEPQRGGSVSDTIRNNLRVILEQEQIHGRQILPHLNHPNFGYAVTAKDIASVESERFFEVYNGHPGVNHLGDKDRPGIEEMWDQINELRASLNIPLLFGIATDDSHEYHGKKGSRPGRGWVMVKSRYLTPEHLIKAMKRGDFYASSGVTLQDITFKQESQTLSVKIAPVEGATYTIEFIGVPRSDAEHGHVHGGEIFKSVDGTEASYQLADDQWYVRAVVTSDQPHADPSFSDQKQQAWTQPVGWAKEASGE